MSTTTRQTTFQDPQTSSNVIHQRLHTNTRKIVTFNEDRNKTFEFEMVHENNKQHIWFDDFDFQVFKERDIQMSLNSTTTSAEFPHMDLQAEDDEFGLENEQSWANRMANNRRALVAVLGLQELCQQKHKDGTKTIAKLYTRISKDAIQSALESAQQNEYFVEECRSADDVLTNEEETPLQQDSRRMSYSMMKEEELGSINTAEISMDKGFDLSEDEICWGSVIIRHIRSWNVKLQGNPSLWLEC